jgi:hypothetical protein
MVKRGTGPARKLGAPKRIPGTDPRIALRLCESCRYELPLAYYSSLGAKTCFVCLDAKRAAKPWEPRQIAMLVAAAKRVLDLWPKYVDMLDDDDLQRFRELLAATDREAGVPLNVLQNSMGAARAEARTAV